MKKNPGFSIRTIRYLLVACIFGGIESGYSCDYWIYFGDRDEPHAKIKYVSHENDGGVVLFGNIEDRWREPQPRIKIFLLDEGIPLATAITNQDGLFSFSVSKEQQRSDSLVFYFSYQHYNYLGENLGWTFRYTTFALQPILKQVIDFSVPGSMYETAEIAAPSYWSVSICYVRELTYLEKCVENAHKSIVEKLPCLPYRKDENGVPHLPAIPEETTFIKPFISIRPIDQLIFA